MPVVFMLVSNSENTQITANIICKTAYFHQNNFEKQHDATPRRKDTIENKPSANQRDSNNNKMRCMRGDANKGYSTHIHTIYKSIQIQSFEAHFVAVLLSSKDSRKPVMLTVVGTGIIYSFW